MIFVVKWAYLRKLGMVAQWLWSLPIMRRVRHAGQPQRMLEVPFRVLNLSSTTAAVASRRLIIILLFF